MFQGIFPQKTRRRRFVEKLYYSIGIPATISKNFISLKDAELELIKSSLKANFCQSDEERISKDQVINDLYDDFFYRLDDYRMKTIPWLANVYPLKNLKILEIGCGTGSSTVALAEQGANVTAIDINKSSIADAKERLKIFGLSANLLCMNATEVREYFQNDLFDIIIFSAVLEHMSMEERLSVMNSTFNMLLPGKSWCVLGTPNRLYYLDNHTSLLPFFNWLPDELAMQYAQFSPRDEFRQSLLEPSETIEKTLNFYRWGRGLSYHEFELTMRTLHELNILSDMSSFYKQRRWFFDFLKLTTPASRFESLFHSLYPDIPRCFLQPYLNLIIEK